MVSLSGFSYIIDLMKVMNRWERTKAKGEYQDQARSCIKE